VLDGGIERCWVLSVGVWMCMYAYGRQFGYFGEGFVEFGLLSMGTVLPFGPMVGKSRAGLVPLPGYQRESPAERLEWVVSLAFISRIIQLSSKSLAKTLNSSPVKLMAKVAA